MPNIWNNITFTNNFKKVGAPFMLDFLWSISVEEQFYIIFGLFCFVLQKQIIWFPVVLLTIYAIFKLFFNNTNPIHLINNFPYFAAGIYGAILWQKYKVILQNFFNNKPKITIAFLFLLTCYFAFYATFLYQFAFYNIVIEPFLLSILFTITVVAAATINNNYSTFVIPFSYLGKITYGLYIWHGFVLTICYKVLEKYLPENNPLNILFFINFSVNLLIGINSYKIIEKPFLLLKTKFK